MVFDKKDRLNFLASTFLECVSDELRHNVLNQTFNGTFDSKEYTSKDNVFSQKTIDSIFDESNSYEDILNDLICITNSNMIIMFQVSEGVRITEHTTYDKMVVLAESKNEGSGRRFPILRSELLKFFRVADSVLSIGETIKVVSVDSMQSDEAVGNYKRIPCTIAFVMFNYGGYLKQAEQYIYFAIFYKMKDKGIYPHLLDILPSVRNLLLFRPYLINRIGKDFEKNVYGRNRETAWKNQWLSIEKAGAHADNDLIDSVINNSGYNNQCINKLFFGQVSEKSFKNEQNVIQLVSNILIARYFRLLFSSTKGNHRIVDEINDDNKVLEKIIFFDVNNRKMVLNNNTNIQIEYDSSLFDKWYMCKTVSSDNSLGRGVPCKVYNTFRKKYLMAFLVDVFNNISKRSSNVRISVNVESGCSIGFLKIANSVVESNVLNSDVYPQNWNTLVESEKHNWCQSLNYKLKQSIEFENAEFPDIKKGISLGCLNSFINSFPFGKMRAYYTVENNTIWYQLELPIVENLGGNT